MKKSLLFALGAFVGLLLVVVLTRQPSSVGVPKLTLPVFDAAAVTGIEVSGAQQAKLSFESGSWSVGEKKYAADSAQVTNALTELSKMRAGDFITENAAKHIEYEVDDAKGLKVKLAPASFEVVFGKAASSGGTYFRQAGSNAVFVTKSSAGYAFRKNVTAWRKKAIATAAASDVAKVELEPVEADGFTIVQGEATAWSIESKVLPKGFRFDPAAASRLVTTLTSLSAQDFADDDGGLGGGEKHLVAKLTLKDGKPLTLHFGAKLSNGNVPLRIDGDPQTYVVSGYLLDQLPKHLDQLRDLSLVAFAPEKATKVTITAAGKKTVAVKDGAEWKLLEPKTGVDEFDPSQVSAFLSRLGTTRATKLAASSVTPAQTGLAKPSAIVELVVDGGKPQTLTFGNELADASAGKQVFVRGSVDDATYVIAANEKTRLEAGAAVFNRPPAPPPGMGMGGMQGLDSLPPDVRAKIEAQLRQQMQPPH